MPSTTARVLGRGAPLLAVLVVVLFAYASPAAARDTLAPRGSSDHWLPREDWVYRHWLPFDRAAVTGELGVSAAQLEAFLFDDRRTLVQLARARGIKPGALRDRLVAPAVEGITDPERVATLRSRAWRMLTQGHLAQHVLYHPYHGLDAKGNARELFGLGPRAYFRARLRGATPLQLARADGRSSAELGAALDALYIVDHDEGLRLQVTSPVAATDMLALRRAQVGCWIRRTIPGTDRSHPYAEQHRLKQRRKAVRTAAQLREDEAIVERFRTTRPSSCWNLPERWAGPVVEPPRASDPDPDPALRDEPAPTPRATPRAVCVLAS